MRSFVTLHKYKQNDQVKDDEMAGYVARWGRREMHIQFFLQNQ
jgi:hypothetical protein